MTRRALVGVCLGLSVACVSVGRAELPRHHAKPKALPCIPGYDYRPTDVRPAPTATAIGFLKLDITPVTPVVPGSAEEKLRNTTRVYQMLDPRLQVDHCFLSRMAATLHDDGTFEISFRADQNPQPGTNDVRSPLKPGEVLNIPLQTSQLRRNTFVVKMRGYGAAPVTLTKPDLAPGAPVLVEFPVMEFMVQRGEPASKQVTGASAAVKKNFLMIDRMEVEFTYR